MRLIKVRRDLWLPRWALAVVAAWLALIGIAEWRGHAAGAPATLCLFRRATGLPCPTCGTTRAVLCLLRGDVAGAAVQNPLMLAAGITTVILLGLRLLAGRGPELQLAPRWRVIPWAVVITMVGVNWAYELARADG